MDQQTLRQLHRLSPSKLSLMFECPLCFWLGEAKGIHRPKLNFALQSNFDRIIKDYFDSYRTKGVPPELTGKVPGHLFPDTVLLEQWRNALRPTLVYQDPRHPKYALAGGLDDCLIDGDSYIPIDFKTTGSSSFEENSVRYYQHQLDIYCLLLDTQGYRTRGQAFLVYYKPESVVREGIVKFQIVVKEMKTDPERGAGLFRQAIALIEGPAPKRHSACEFCSWGNDYAGVE